MSSLSSENSPRGNTRSEAEPVADAVRLLRECHKSHEGPPENGTLHIPIWEVLQETLKDIHEEELDHLLPRAAEQPDHYINGTPQKPACRRLSTPLARVDSGYLTPTMIMSSA